MDKTRVYEQDLGKGGDENILTRLDSLHGFLLFTWYSASAKQCTPLVLSLMTNQMKEVV